VLSEAWIVDAVRTPVGRYGGALATVRPDDLAAIVLRALVSRTGVDRAAVDDVVLGCSNQAGEDNRNVARMSALLAGFPVEVPGVTINRLCGSGLEAVAQAARSILTGDAHLVAAGGVESMTRAPLVTGKADRAFPRGPATAYDTALGWRFVNPLMEERYGAESMGQTAENLAEEYRIPRPAQDALALSSHRRATQAAASGRFRAETVAVPVGDGLVEGDEGPRPDTSLDKLAALPPVFRAGGTVTAGNSSPLSDGAAALLLASREFAEAHGLRPLARVRATATAGVPPRVMGIGPVPATAKLLERSGLALPDIGLIELNEAFAAQVLAVLEEWKMEPDDPRLNPNGGAVAIGHPIGSTGARLLTTLVYEMRRSDVALGLATMCIGVGQGTAMLVERLA
jgi:acetyl-CoA acyltransferase